MIFYENTLNFIIRQLVRIKVDQKIGNASSNSLVRPNFKSYLKLFLLNKFDIIYKIYLLNKYSQFKTKKDISQLHTYLIDKKDSYDTVCFDIFDTIIYRRIPGESVKDVVCKIISNKYDYDFKRIRHLRYESECEIGSKYQADGFDPDNRYEDVINLFIKKIRKEYQKNKHPTYEQIKRIELDIEKECQYIKPEIISLLQWIHKNQKKIIFISDFYFSSNVIFEFLQNQNVSQYFTNGYSSADFKLTKKSGRLYELLITQKLIDTSRTIMIGDNVQSDLLSARANGLDSCLLFDIGQKIRNKKIEFTENLRKQNPFFESSSMIEVIDDQINTKNNNINYSTGLVVAPLYISYIEKIIKYCKNNNIKHIYFLSREGKVFKKVFDLINIDKKIDSEYLVVSRLSTYLPSITDLNWGEIRRMWDQYDKQTPELFLYNLNLPAKMLAHFKRYGLKDNEIIDDTYNLKKLKALLNDRLFRNDFEKHKRTQKENFLNYLRKLKVPSNKKIALVDIGWKGTIQNNLEKILPTTSIIGLYFGYIGEISAKKNGLIVNPTSNWYEKLVFDNGPLFEMSTTPDEGSCIRYDQDGPITQQKTIEHQNYKNFFEDMQEAIYDYAKLYSRFSKILQIDTNYSSYMPIDRVVRYIIDPAPKEISLYQRYSHIESFGVRTESKFNYKWRWDYVFSDYNILNTAKRFKHNFFNQFWVIGNIKKTKIPLMNFLYLYKTKISK